MPGRAARSGHRGLGEAYGHWVPQTATDGQGPGRHQAWLPRSQMRPIGEVEQEAAGVGAGAWELIAQRLCY